LDEFRRLVFAGDAIPASGTLVRRHCHERVGYYDPRLPHSGDWDLWLRLSTRYKIGYIAEPLYAYRVHRTNMHHSTIPPSQATDEYVQTIRNAFEALEPGSSAELRDLFAPAVRRAWLHAAAVECGSNRMNRAWEALLDAARRYPAIVCTRAFYATLAKLALHIGVGHANYARFASVWRRARLLRAS
jgi:hypothetical protein